MRLIHKINSRVFEKNDEIIKTHFIIDKVSLNLGWCSFSLYICIYIYLIYKNYMKVVHIFLRNKTYGIDGKNNKINENSENDTKTSDVKISVYVKGDFAPS